MSENEIFDPKKLHEIKKAPERPEKLYRAYTVNPESITLESFKEILKPKNHAADDPTRIGDGNELGVYMSTNRYMVQKVYASGGKAEGAFVATERYISHGGQAVGINLPVCGIVIEVDTENLPIREPRMTQALIGHYNNGFEGYEWIADEVPPTNYHVVRLTLSTHANDQKRLTIDVSSMNDEELLEAIGKIKTEYLKAQQQAFAFKAFLETLTPQQRMNEFVLKRLWEKHQTSQ